jgi:hypothetical protein
VELKSTFHSFREKHPNKETQMAAMRKFSGVALATAAAFAFSTVAVTTASAAEEAKVKCEGVNSCAGTSACKTATNECKGKNGCAGHGFLELSKADCDAAKAAKEKKDKG